MEYVVRLGGSFFFNGWTCSVGFFYGIFVVKRKVKVNINLEEVRDRVCVCEIGRAKFIIEERVVFL